MLQVKINKPKVKSKERVAIYLTEQEIELFKAFRKYQDEFQFLLDGNYFSFKNGEATITKDELGIAQNIRISVLTNKRRRTI